MGMDGSKASSSFLDMLSRWQARKSLIASHQAVPKVARLGDPYYTIIGKRYSSTGARKPRLYFGTCHATSVQVAMG
jgi:hypothetical protein